MKRTFAVIAAVGLLAGGLCGLAPPASGEPAAAPIAETSAPALDLFDAMQQGVVDATFIARDSQRGRIVLTNKTDNPVEVQIPDAFIGVPQVQAQFGGGGGGMGGGMGGGGMGGGQQSVGGGGGGGGRGGGGRGGGGGGRGGGGGGRRGGFSIPPEKVVRVDVPLLCLDHGLRDPSSSKPYAIRPIENYITDPAVIAVVSAYANGDLPPGAAQAAVWNLNSGVGWRDLAAKQTGTDRNVVREPYFSGAEIETAMAIVQHATADTAGQKVTPREFTLPVSTTTDDVAREVTETDDAAVEATEEAVAEEKASAEADDEATSAPASAEATAAAAPVAPAVEAPAADAAN